MKTKSKFNWKITIFVILLYFVMLALCAAAVSIYPISYHYNLLKTRIDQYVSTVSDSDNFYNDFNENKRPITMFIYNEDGTECLYFKPCAEEVLQEDYDGYIEPLVSSLKNGSSLSPITLSYFPSKTPVWIVDGRTFSIGDNTYIIVSIEYYSNFFESFIGYIIFFTLCYWVTVYFYLMYARKKRKLDETRQNYVANITHALKTPIASVRVLAETLCDSDIENSNVETRQVYYGMILEETATQSQMVQDILELSKLQSQETKPQKSSVDIKPILDELTKRYSVMCDYYDVTLIFSDTIKSLPPLHTNPEYLKQVMEALLDNAMKYVDEGGKITVNASINKKIVIISIWNNGTAISSADLPYIFDRFYQGANAQKSGSGLGLAIVKEIIDKLNEKVWAESDPNKGTTIYFTMHLK